MIALLPFIGLGYWKHQRDKRQGKAHILPRGWFVWRKMILVNAIYMAVLLLITLAFIYSLSTEMIGGGSDFAKGEDNPAAWGFGFLWDAGAGIAWGLIAVVLLLSFVIVGLILLLAPLLISNWIKSSHLNHQMALMRAQQKRERLEHQNADQ